VIRLFASKAFPAASAPAVLHPVASKQPDISAKVAAKSAAMRAAVQLPPVTVMGCRLLLR